VTQTPLIRPLQSSEDYAAFESLQKETWGQNLSEIISGSMASIVQKIGGIAAGAFDETGEMLGFVFGFAGFKDRVPVHWSHLLAVKEKARNKGIGRQLKLYQREVLLKLGVKNVYWTFDPLVAKNASLNFNLLGARAVDYVVDMYGSGDDIDLFRGLGTDRFVMKWEIESDAVTEILSGRRKFTDRAYGATPVVVKRALPSDPNAMPELGHLERAPRVRIEIPAEIHALRDVSVASASAWRQKTREAFQFYLSAGYEVMGLAKSSTGRHFYCLEKKG
jgi:predicted GNAT superfamily acetyltransferase